MRIKQKFNFLGALLMMALFLSAGNSSAQSNPLSADDRYKAMDEAIHNAPVGKSVIIATVDIINAKIISNENGELKISFGISNRIGVQDGLKYAVELRNISNNDLIDRKIYDESLFVGENETVEREVTYSIPRYLSGKYRVLLASQNEKGMSFGAMIAGEIDVASTEKNISIDSSGCFLKVSGVDEVFKLTQGVDVSQEEELVLHCPVSNMFETAMDFSPSFKTNFRTAFGKKVAEEKGSPIRLEAGEKKELTFIIPKVKSPQAYDVEITLLDGGGKRISNAIIVHYVLQGASGTIRNITLDKDAYYAGDVAAISFAWAGRADDFPKSRIGMTRAKTFARVTAVDSKGKSCSEVFSKEVDTKFNGGREDVNVSITSDCQDGKVAVALLDEGGNVLDEKVFDLRGAAEVPVQEKKISILFLALIISGLIFLAGAVAILFRRSKNRGLVGMTVFFLITSSFFLVESAKADQFDINYSYWHAEFTHTLSGYASIGGDGAYRFCANDDMWMYMTGVWDGCTNTADSIASTFYQNVNNPSGRVHPFFAEQSTSGSGTGHHRAPLISGYYDMNVTGAIFEKDDFNENSSDYVSSGNHLIRYRVDNPINGQCGTPPGALCSSGDLSGPPTQIGSTMYWTCLGKTNYGCRAGSDASCSAPALVCQGTVPANATACAGDNTYVPLGTSWHYEPAGCTANKCEYVCNGGFVWNGSSCVIPSCTGTDPLNGVLCAGDNTGLSVDVAKKAVSACSATKCEYLCNSGYIPNGTSTSCVLPWCSGADPSGATLCSGDDTGLLAVTSKVSVLECSVPSGRKCEYDCIDPSACLVGGVCTSPGPDVYTYTCQTGDCSGNCGDSVQNSCTVTTSNNCMVIGTSFTTVADCVANGEPCANETQCGPCAGNYREVNP